MKKTLLTMALALAMFTGVEAQTVLPLLPSAHGLIENQPAYNAQPQQQTQEFATMATGWNWWSSYIDLSEGGLTMLENMLGTNAGQIKSQADGFVVYGGGSWTGTLSSISNTKMYAIRMGAIPETAPSIQGIIVDPTTTSIVLNNGWNWIGYPCSTANTDINAALTNYTAVANDQFKSYNSGFVTFNATTNTWTGTLASIVPGNGYKFKAGLGEGNTTSFTFVPATRNNIIVNSDALVTRWNANTTDYSDNMTMIAIANLMGNEIRGDQFEIGAFVGNQCRGAVKLMEVNDPNHFYAFLSVLGNENESLQFRLMDYESGETYVADNIYKYAVDAAEGSLDEPYILNFNTLMSNDEFMVGKMDMFPNPVKQDGMLTLSIPALSKNMKVQVINSLGMIVKSENMSAEKANLSVNLAPGVYTVKVVAGDKQLYVEKLIVE